MSSYPETDDYDSPGTRTSLHGEVFIKPATDVEIHFYDEVNANPDYKELAMLMPRYYGALENIPVVTAEEAVEHLNKKSTPGAGHHKVGEREATESEEDKGHRISAPGGIALESMTHGFKEPNTLDVKLGAILYDKLALTKTGKVGRFRDMSEKTTSKNMGFRFAGMKVFRGHDLGRNTAHVDHDGFTNYDKYYGQNLQDDDIHDAFRKFLFAPEARVNAELGAYVAEAFLTEVRKMIKVLEGIESRMYSASILFVYEGDGDKLREAIMEQMRLDRGGEPKVLGKDDEGAVITWDPKVFACKLIDFAHATIGEDAMKIHKEPVEVSPERGLKDNVEWVQSNGGPDENMLKGMRKVADILQQVKDKGPLTSAESDALAARVAANTKAKAEADFMAKAKAKAKTEASEVNGSTVNGTK